MVEQINPAANLKEMNEGDFSALVESHQWELRAHCYRMLGSIQEADELVQETFWRAWDRRETYQGRASIRAWLYKIATNLCIDALRQRPRRGLPVTREEAASLDQPMQAAVNEPVWLEPYPFDLPGPEANNPEAKYALQESIRLAFVVSLQLLPPLQRAVLILRDGMDWSASEVAEALGVTLASVKSALHRARSTLERRQPSLQQETIPRLISEETSSNWLESYVQAWETADVEGLVALLKDDCAFSMPPTPTWYSGRENIGQFVGKTIFSGQAAGRWKLIPTRANGQPGFGLYRLNESSGAYDAYGIQVLTLDGGLIADITTFRNPGLLKFFDLPASI
jgi:RNA polymerase sigma-70 factor (ECF subfamily)